MSKVRAAAEAVLQAESAYRAALNGMGHPGEDHDHGIHVYSDASDCSACGGAQYGTDDALSQAYGDLRVALGHKRLPWEYDRDTPASA